MKLENKTIKFFEVPFYSFARVLPFQKQSSESLDFLQVLILKTPNDARCAHVNQCKSTCFWPRVFLVQIRNGRCVELKEEGPNFKYHIFEYAQINWWWFKGTWKKGHLCAARRKADKKWPLQRLIQATRKRVCPL